MRILIVSNLYPPVVFGGYEILCRQVTEKLKSRGHEIEVLTSDFGADEVALEPGVHRRLALTTDFPKTGEDVTWVDFTLATMHKVALRNEPAVLSRIDEFHPELIFCWCLSRLSLAPIWAAQRRAVPVCYTLNDEHPKQFRFVASPGSPRSAIKAMLERHVYAKATLYQASRFPITAISQALKDKLIAQGLPFQHAQVIYQGVPLEDFTFRPRRREPDEALKLLYVGQLSQTKGVHTLIEAAAQLRQAQPELSLELSIAGTGVPSYVESLRQLVHERDLSDRVQFLGKVPHAEIASVYRDHHVLVFSSEWDEPFGLTHVEAMACGCAVISTTTGGSRELVKDGLNALAYQAGDKLDLAQKIKQVADDEEKRWKLLGQARRYIEENHSLDGYVSQLETFLQGVVKG
jgi:glycosyltransferase involved in cell wall biosynthesis